MPLAKGDFNFRRCRFEVEEQTLVRWKIVEDSRFRKVPGSVGSHVDSNRERVDADARRAFSVFLCRRLVSVPLHGPL